MSTMKMMTTMKTKDPEGRNRECYLKPLSNRKAYTTVESHEDVGVIQPNDEGDDEDERSASNKECYHKGLS